MASFESPRGGTGQHASDEEFAVLLVHHSLEAAEDCMERFFVAENEESPADGPLTYENLFTTYLAMAFAYLREYGMAGVEALVASELGRAFGTSRSKTAETVANIYRVRDFVHPSSRSVPFDQLEARWPLLVRSVLHEYHRARFGRASFRQLVEEEPAAEYLAEHVKRVGAHCRVRAEARRSEDAR